MNKAKILSLQEAAIERNTQEILHGVPRAARPFMEDNMRLRQKCADLEAALKMTTDTLSEYQRADAELIERIDAESSRRDDERDELLLHISQLEGDIKRLGGRR